MLRSALVDHRVMEGLPPEFYRRIESCEGNAQITRYSLNVIRNEVESIVIRY
ncbi:MAG: hypothetical protein QN835_03745 [Nitrososphaeraceae archaeon]|nr:hypothetical protein [Nitrososphaeraceae archaeon]